MIQAGLERFQISGQRLYPVGRATRCEPSGHDKERWSGRSNRVLILLNDQLRIACGFQLALLHP